MYESFYGLNGKPFQLNPDPSFYFDSRQHRRAMSYLEYGLHQNEGFIVVTGEIGAGKTTLVRNLLEKLDNSNVIAVHMVTTQLDAADMLRMVAAAFGVPSKGLQKSDLLLALEAHFVAVTSAGRRCLMIVDEAQNLTPAAIEELRMLSNFQLETHALLQSFLIGQPEFRITLQGPSMEQLRQRVIATAHIGAMGELETREYIEHRLRRVGWGGVPNFDDASFRTIHEHTAGVPRRINSLCDRLMWYGYLSEKRSFGSADVLEVADELKEEVRPARLSENAAAQAPTTVLPFTGRSDGKSNVSLSPEVQASLVSHLRSIDAGIKQLELTMQRVERSNLLNSTSFKRLLEWAQSRDSSTRSTVT